MVKLGFSLIWLGLIWFGCYPYLEKKYSENTGEQRKIVEKPTREKKNWREKDLAVKNRRGIDIAGKNLIGKDRR